MGRLRCAPDYNRLLLFLKVDPGAKMFGEHFPTVSAYFIQIRLRKTPVCVSGNSLPDSVDNTKIDRPTVWLGVRQLHALLCNTLC